MNEHHAHVFRASDGMWVWDCDSCDDGGMVRSWIYCFDRAWRHVHIIKNLSLFFTQK